MKIAIVTDSASDIPEELAEKHHIHIVYNHIIIGEQSLLDAKDISREEFYRRLPDMPEQPTTATASAGVYHELYEKLLTAGADVVLSIHTSGKLSGILNSATAAAQGFKDRVRVIDSGMITLALGFQVLAAAEAVESGATLDKVLKMLEDVRRRARLSAMLDTLEYVRRSGRVSWARARLGNLLHIKPLIEVRDGVIYNVGQARTFQKGIQRLKEMILNLGRLERLAMLHTNAEQAARQILSEINPQLPKPPLVVNVTTVIGTHVGPNGLGFAALVE
ncbi:MAG: DegV family protein [Chloroflexi bacterium]|jgi:DegV family protein with EDD domain|nr:DegV family protein [Chloroflexota bacterium]